MAEREKYAEGRTLKAKEIGKRLRQMMAEKDVSQKDLAKISGVSVSTISNLTRGLQAPMAEVIQPIVDVLECSIEYLIDGNPQLFAPYDRQVVIMRIFNNLDVEGQLKFISMAEKNLMDAKKMKVNQKKMN